MAESKGNSVKIKTFFDWNVSNTIGYKDDGVRVNFVVSENYCVNHRIELAVKAAFEDSPFSAVDRFYIANFALMKNSGAIKSAVKHASSSFDISHYELTKMTGTRFVSHRRKALTRLLNIWPALTSAYETILLTRTSKAETKGKIQGFLKNLKSYEILGLFLSLLLFRHT